MANNSLNKAVATTVVVTAATVETAAVVVVVEIAEAIVARHKVATDHSNFSTILI